MGIRKIGRRAWSLLLVLVLLLSLGTQAFAENGVAKDETGKVYTSISDAWAAAKEGRVIMLLADWKLDDRLMLGEKESAVLDLNGFTIDAQNGFEWAEMNGEVFYLDEGAKLTLESTAEKKEIEFKGWVKPAHQTVTVLSGGLITGGRSTNGGGGVHMKEGATLTLDNVILGGCCTEEMITEGYALYGDGAGVNMDGDNCTLIMKNGAEIAYNLADDSGGAVYVGGQDATIEMSGGSSMHNNWSYGDGGAVCFCYGGFTIRSDDLSGSIYNCKAVGGFVSGYGGAIYVEQCKYSKNQGLIYGLTMENNSSLEDGGAIYLGQENITVSNCTILNNMAEDGGGIYVNNDDNLIEDCVIRWNIAKEEGGGMYCCSGNDIDLSGKVIIKNNTRKDGSPDDLYLDGSYMISAPDTGSEIGLRTDATKTRQVGETAQFDEKLFFSDVSGFYMHEDAKEKTLRLVAQDNASYPVTVNGKLQGYYNDNALLTIDDQPTPEDKVFQYWTGDADVLDDMHSETAVVHVSQRADRSALSFTAQYTDKYPEKAAITEVEQRTLKVEYGSDEETVRGLLPAIAMVTDENGNYAFVEVDSDSDDLDFGTVLENGMAVSEGTILVPLKLKEDDTVKNPDGKMLPVTVQILHTAELAVPVVTAPTAKTGLTCTGEDLVLINPGSATGGTMVYSSAEDGPYSEKIPTADAAGEYTVWYKVVGDAGYEDTQPQSLRVSVAEAEPAVTADLSGETAITADQAELTYQVSLADAVQAATATVTMNFSGEVAKVSAADTNGWVVLAQDYKNGVFTAVVLNYEGMTGSGDILTVTAETTGKKGSVSAQLTGVTLSVYDGDVKTFADTVLGSVLVETEIDYSRFDINMDGIVNQLDIARAQRAYDAQTGDANWNARADVDGSGKVDIGDFILILNNYTKR